MKLEGRVAVVTGASMGIGEAIAAEFVHEGAKVVLASRDAGRCEAARVRIGAGDRTLATSCDVREQSQLQALVEGAIARFGRIDLWVNNAGFGLLDSVGNMRIEDCRALFETNFFGAVQASQAVLPVMRRQGSGTIVNVSSVAGHVPVPYMAAYCASKAALNSFSYGLRMELRGTGINVLNVCPGFVATDFGRNAIRGTESRRLSSTGPRGVTPERVARAVVRGCLLGRREIVVPWYYRPLIAVYKRWPGTIEAAMSRNMGNH